MAGTGIRVISCLLGLADARSVMSRRTRQPGKSDAATLERHYWAVCVVLTHGTEGAAKRRSPMSYAEERVSEAWSSNHAHLTNLAFGILGDLGAAEDAVQEAFARLVAADVDGILDDRGWLTVVTSRICFDKIRSAPRRREFGYEDTTLETTSNPLLSPGAGNPLDRITLDDEVRLALLVMLQRLSPGRTGGLRPPRRVPGAVRHHRRNRGAAGSDVSSVGPPGTPEAGRRRTRALRLSRPRTAAGHPGVHRRMLRRERRRPPPTARPRGGR